MLHLSGSVSGQRTLLKHTVTRKNDAAPHIWKEVHITQITPVQWERRAWAGVGRSRKWSFSCSLILRNPSFTILHVWGIHSGPIQLILWGRAGRILHTESTFQIWGAASFLRVTVISCRWVHEYTYWHHHASTLRMITYRLILYYNHMISICYSNICQEVLHTTTSYHNHSSEYTL